MEASTVSDAQLEAVPVATVQAGPNRNRADWRVPAAILTGSLVLYVVMGVAVYWLVASIL